MALTKEKKNEVVAEVSELLQSSKMTVVAKYQGTPVKALQSLRREAKQNGTKVKVIKNRLFRQALKGSKALESVDSKALEGMLLFAFNSEDEVAPAQALAEFAKANPTLEFVGAFSPEGKFLSADEVSALAKLPGKTVLIASIINTLNSPVRGVISSLSGDLHGILRAVEAKASN